MLVKTKLAAIAPIATTTKAPMPVKAAAIIAIPEIRTVPVSAQKLVSSFFSIPGNSILSSLSVSFSAVFSVSLVFGCSEVCGLLSFAIDFFSFTTD